MKDKAARPRTKRVIYKYAACGNAIPTPCNNGPNRTVFSWHGRVSRLEPK
jgi:hypothetical protein